uniref:Nucleic-acid-binding protein n=1 Tax=Sipha flava TaxID=143950 RepID=A0A2S2QEX8_9HEMI
MKEQIHTLDFTTRSITNCFQYKIKNPLLLFCVGLESSPSNQTIYKADSICYTNIKVEVPRSKKNPVQCLRCQNYGYIRTYYHHMPKCVKCGNTHLSNEC